MDRCGQPFLTDWLAYVQFLFHRDSNPVYNWCDLAHILNLVCRNYLSWVLMHESARYPHAVKSIKALLALTTGLFHFRNEAL